MYEVIIIGSGPAGLSAGLFSGLYSLKTLIVCQHLGGQAILAPLIFDYPGIRKIKGKDWVKALLTQIKEAGVEMIEGKVSSIKYQVSQEKRSLRLP